VAVEVFHRLSQSLDRDDAKQRSSKETRRVLGFSKFSSAYERIYARLMRDSHPSTAICESTWSNCPLQRSTASNRDRLITITGDCNRSCAISPRISFGRACLVAAIARINIKSRADIGIADKVKSPDDFFEATPSATNRVHLHTQCRAGIKMKLRYRSAVAISYLRGKIASRCFHDDDTNGIISFGSRNNLRSFDPRALTLPISISLFLFTRQREMKGKSILSP